ncbi:MAG: ROK family protein [Hyphomicrobiaceae bacterium]|nr:ROK family protein [Hyphomicrobiaceae bacterium]
MTQQRLVADVGGTNVRFAAADAAGNLRRVASYRVAAFASFADALEDYLRAQSPEGTFTSCAIGAAGPVENGIVDLTNHPWRITADETSARLGGIATTVCNDLEAVAAALPYLNNGDVTLLGPCRTTRPEHRTMLAVNVGTGFGASTALLRGGAWWTVPSEAGHISLGAWDVAEREWMEPNATVESVLSGRGIAALYARLAGSPNGMPPTLPVRRSDDSREAAAIDSISRLLGRVAGDLALATAAWGGVYLCGSVTLAWSAIADPAPFREAFESKGPMRERLQHVATGVIVRPNIALYGLAKMQVESMHSATIAR